MRGLVGRSLRVSREKLAVLREVVLDIGQVLNVALRPLVAILRFSVLGGTPSGSEDPFLVVKPFLMGVVGVSISPCTSHFPI